MVKDQYCVTNDHSSYNQWFSSFDWERKKPLQWQNGYKGLFSAGWDRFPPFSFRQRVYTWINCAEQRLNYVGWRITQGSFCCPARTRSHPTQSCQQVFSSNSHSSKKEGYFAHRPVFLSSFWLPSFFKASQHKSEKRYLLCIIIFGIFSALVHVESAIISQTLVHFPTKQLYVVECVKRCSLLKNLKQWQTKAAEISKMGSLWVLQHTSKCEINWKKQLL